MSIDIQDFAFLTGEWTIKNRRLKAPGSDEWELFDGEATVYSLLGGRASIEELRSSSNAYLGMGVRVLNTETGLWADHWVSHSFGVVNEPMTGSFTDGVGTFLAEEIDDGRPVLARGVWDRITPTSCRWHQATSTDGGASWDANWYMDWTRVR